METLGQTPPSSRQLLVLRLMGLVSPPAGLERARAHRGFLLLIAIVIVLMALGFGLAKLVALPFGGVGTFGGLLLGARDRRRVLGVLTLLGRRRQAKAQAARQAAAERQPAARAASCTSAGQAAPVLARERVVRASSVKIADHHLADVVALDRRRRPNAS